MKTVFIGCVDFSHAMLSKLLKLEGLDIAGVVTRYYSVYNTDFHTLAPFAVENNIPFFYAQGNQQQATELWIRKINPDVIFCVGWSHLLSPGILSIPKEGVIGYHPTLLPRNRGRHPIIWALALGLHITGSTFFIMDNGIDSGDIISQRDVPISYDDDAASLYAKLQDVASEQLKEIVDMLGTNTLERRPQNQAQASYWRKRGIQDGKIDWRMPTKGIHNLVRALARPYLGAYCINNDNEPTIWATVPSSLLEQNIEPGRVLDVDELAITIKTGDGAIILVEHEFLKMPEVGDYLS